MKPTIVLFLVLFVSLLLNGQVITFNDVNFKNRLLESSPSNTIAKDLNGNYFAIDSNADSEISIQELENVSYFSPSCINYPEFNCPNEAKAANMDEFQYFVNLDSVQFNYTFYKEDITINLSNLPKLKKFKGSISSGYFDGNMPSGGILLENCPMLEEVILKTDTGIIDLSFSGSSNIKIVDLRIGSAIATWDDTIDNIPSIVSSALADPSLSGIEKIAIRNYHDFGADFSFTNLPNLLEVELDEIVMSNLNLSNNPKLTKVSLIGEIHNELNVSDLPDFNQLLIGGGFYTSYAGYGFFPSRIGFLNAENSASLEHIIPLGTFFPSENLVGIDDFNLNGCNSLREVYHLNKSDLSLNLPNLERLILISGIEDNNGSSPKVGNISTINFEGLPALRELEIVNHSITNLEITGLNFLERVNASYNPYLETFLSSGNPNLNSIALYESRNLITVTTNDGVIQNLFFSGIVDDNFNQDPIHEDLTLICGDLDEITPLFDEPGLGHVVFDSNCGTNPQPMPLAEFVDENFKAKLLESNDTNYIASDRVNSFAVDKNHDGQIDISEPASWRIRELRLANSNIQSAADLHFFQNLRELDISHNSIDEITLPGNQVWLGAPNLSNNNLTGIPLGNNSGDAIDISNNEIKVLDFSLLEEEGEDAALYYESEGNFISEVIYSLNSTTTFYGGYSFDTEADSLKIRGYSDTNGSATRGIRGENLKFIDMSEFYPRDNQQGNPRLDELILNTPNLEHIDLRNGIHDINLPNYSSFIYFGLDSVAPESLFVCADSFEVDDIYQQISSSVNPPNNLIITSECESTLSTNNLQGSSLEFTIYPNPVSEVLKVISSSKIKELEIYDSTGRLVMVVDNQLEINVSNLKKGTYYLLASGSGAKRSLKFIKQ